MIAFSQRILRFVAGVSIKEIARRTGRDRNTVRRALRSSEPPVYRRAAKGSKLDPFKEEIHRRLREDPKLLVTETQLDAVADELNARPRKRLAFANPTEQLAELLLQ